MPNKKMMPNKKIRKAAVAGTFYPQVQSVLMQTINVLLQNASAQGPCPKAIIAPHAGYVYSGPTAATVYCNIANARDVIKKVVLLGPSHRVGFYGIATTSAEFYDTPLGQVPIDRESLTKIAACPCVKQLDAAHALEHSLEVHVPFLQTVLKDFLLVPLVVGECAPDDVALVLDNLWGGSETLIVISSDLSHYHDYASAKTIDDKTRQRIENLDCQLGGDEACGCHPVNGLLLLARQKALQVKTIDVRNSGDTAGTRDRVVGYGAWAFYEK